MTVADLITNTLKLIGVIAKTEVPSPDEMTDSFNRLNSMLDAWGADRLTIFQVVRTVFNLTNGKGFPTPYTIGIGGDFNIVRPVFIQRAGVISLNTNPSFELPVRLLSDDEFADITIKGTPASLTWYLYYDYGFDSNQRGNIYVWPVPNVGNLQLALYVPTAVTQFAGTDKTVLLPPGYEEAIRYNLAVRLCPEFGRQIDPVVAKMAADSFEVIERANKRLDPMGIDPALLGSSDRRIFNWLTGESTGFRST